MASVEDTLALLADSMYTAFIPDARPGYTEKFVRTLVRCLKSDSSYFYAFPVLSKKINIISPDDGSFRIFNWCIAPSEHSLRYYGAIQLRDTKLSLIPLVDCSPELGKSAIDTVLASSRWFGALYYRIITTKDEEGSSIYTLLGLNAASPISNKKVMDPLRIVGLNASFGAPVFNKVFPDGKKLVRYIMEYKKDVQATLNWDAGQQLIYCDRLVSSMNDPNRAYTFVPSGVYDGFRWVDNSWQLVSDIMPVVERADGAAPAPIPLKKE